ncbi:MAG: hypothetical protein K1Y36_03300 [Blastocatellia bacterium]|nr:hypothetical protein [Blastocatellia bacterium]
MSGSFRKYSAFVTATLFSLLLLAQTTSAVLAHPLGNFTINHFSRLQVETSGVKVRYVVDMAEIPTFQEIQAADKESKDGPPTANWLKQYAETTASRLAQGLVLTVDGVRVPLQVTAKTISLPPGAGNLPTLRLECDLTGSFAGSLQTRRLKYEDTNFPERLGWREMVLVPGSGVSLFDSTAFGNGLTDELKAYPENMIAAPLNERALECSLSQGALPAGAAALKTRDGKTVTPSRDQLAELISVRELTPGVMLFGILLAFVLGGAHALSPGHGKTVVGAYLVGSRGTWKHAGFLGLTVTITHTAGVFALGLITLFASKYIVPERLFPILSFVSGILVLGLGGHLFIQRSRALAGGHHHDHHHHDLHHHDHQGMESFTHTHDGNTHSHLPPGMDGEKITWKSLLALGISGGLLPCPSALVVLLSAIALHRVGYGLILVVAFSAGLAGVLTAIGIGFVYAGKFFAAKEPQAKNGKLARLVKVMPVLSALVIASIGFVMCLQTVPDLKTALHPPTAQTQVVATASQPKEEHGPSLAGLGAIGILGLGLVFGLKHATEADHVVAVTTILTEHKSVARAAMVGALWGIGHTASIFMVGLVVLVLRISIPENVSSWLEFGVALMIIGLGANALLRALLHQPEPHVHAHDLETEPYLHKHESDHPHHHHQPGPHLHLTKNVGIKPLIVGMVHGLAGSAALTLLVLSQITSTILGLTYLLVFGIGSIGGMLLMSGLVGLPFVLAAEKLDRFHLGLRVVAGTLSIAFGLWYAYETGVIF